MRDAGEGAWGASGAVGQGSEAGTDEVDGVERLGFVKAFPRPSDGDLGFGVDRAGAIYGDGNHAGDGFPAVPRDAGVGKSGSAAIHGAARSMAGDRRLCRTAEIFRMMGCRVGGFRVIAAGS